MLLLDKGCFLYENLIILGTRVRDILMSICNKIEGFKSKRKKHRHKPSSFYSIIRRLSSPVLKHKYRLFLNLVGIILSILQSLHILFPGLNDTLLPSEIFQEMALPRRGARMKGRLGVGYPWWWCQSVRRPGPPQGSSPPPASWPPT